MPSVEHLASRRYRLAGLFGLVAVLALSVLSLWRYPNQFAAFVPSEIPPNARPAGGPAPIATPFGDATTVPLVDIDLRRIFGAELHFRGRSDVERCMTTRRIDYLTVRSPVNGPLVLPHTREFAELRGFGQEAESYASTRTDLVSRSPFDVLSSTTEAALAGPYGCQTQGLLPSRALGHVLEHSEVWLAPIREDYKADARYQVAADEWRTCVADQGYVYVDDKAARSEFTRSTKAIVEAAGATTKDDPGQTDSAHTLIEPAQQQVDALFAEERELAVVIWKCDQERLDALLELQFEYQDRFFAEHRVEVERLVAKTPDERKSEQWLRNRR